MRLACEDAAVAALVHRGEVIAIALGDEIAFLAHAERVEYVLADVAVERLA
ncbi:MAG: hypothetical protein ABI664_12210 [bacterium]